MNPTSKQNNNTSKLIGVGLLIAVLIAAGVVAFAVGGGDEATNTVVTNSSNTNSTGQSTAETPAEDNTSTDTKTITNSVAYDVPEGHRNSIDVTLVLSNTDRTIESVNVVTNYNDSESRQYNTSFENNVQSVVGKDIDNIEESKIGDASLTSSAFYSSLRAAAAEL